MMAMQRDDEPDSFACGCVERGEVTCGPDVDGFSVPGVFNDLGSDVAERTDERGELLVGGVEEFGFKDEGIKGWEMDGGLTCQSRQ